MNTKTVLISCAAITILLAAYTQPVFAQRREASSSAQTAQTRAIISQIDRRIEALNREANRTTSIKDSLVPSEYSAIITDIQSAIQKLEAFKKEVPSLSLQDARQKMNDLRVNTKIMPRVQVRRRAALLYAYNAALAAKIQEYSQKIQTTLLNQPNYTQAKACIDAAEAKRVEGLGLVNGVLSQVGLFEATQQNNARPLYSQLQQQLRQAKQAFDQSRRQMNTCYRQYITNPNAK